MLIPISETSDKDDLRTVINLRLPFKFNLDNTIKGLSLIWTPRFYQYFYAYKTRGGSNKTQYRIQQALFLGYSLNEKWGVFGAARYTNKWNYHGSYLYDNIALDTGINYSLTNQIRFELGYANTSTIFNSERGAMGEFKLYSANNC
ncbi:MAG: hypothetical protein GY714_11110, partial [Desulfobacterales bacterium]|nr:hypothetical protein [Desulfobacterales bacterium]